jgi:tripartite-type tricarboxylate transporter receptor subunit TctC
LQDLVAGNVDVMFDNLASSLPLIEGGKLKLIAVAAPKRLAALPNVPAIAETLPGFEATAWFGIVAPPKTPQNIVNKINADVNEALKQPEIIAKLKAMAAEVVGGTPAATATYMHEEVERWRKVIKAANVTIN